MITVISGTNRPNSKSSLIANFYADQLKQQTEEEVVVFTLEDLPTSILHSEMYDGSKQDPALQEIQASVIVPAQKWVFVLPEYNGSIPGIMKLFIDALSVVDYSKTFGGKKLALVGVTSGRSGNLRGVDHMTNAMQYLGTEVSFDKLLISHVKSVTDETTVTDQDLKETITKHAKNFLAF